MRVKDGKNCAGGHHPQRGRYDHRGYRQGQALQTAHVTPWIRCRSIPIDEKGEGKTTRVDGPDVKLSVPMGLLFTW